MAAATSQLFLRQVKALGRHSAPSSTLLPADDSARPATLPLQQPPLQQLPLGAVVGRGQQTVLFCGHASVVAMERHVRAKQEIVQVIADFALVQKKPVSLFGKLKTRILAQLDQFTANDLGGVCHDWARLGFLQEDFLVAISERVSLTASEASTDALVHLLDGYASTRLDVQQARRAINAQVAQRVHLMQPWQVALHMSSLARLAAAADADADAGEKALLCSLASRASATISEHTAREVALVVYATGKLQTRLGRGVDGVQSAEIGNFQSRAKELLRDFTAKELEMVATGLARLSSFELGLFEGISEQASRRIAQFSGPTLAALVRAFARVARPEIFHSFVTRAMAELPRITAHMETAETRELTLAFRRLGIASGLLDAGAAGAAGAWAAARLQELATQGARDVEQLERLCGRLHVAALDSGRAAELYCALAQLEGWRSASVGSCMQTLMQRALATD